MVYIISYSNPTDCNTTKYNYNVLFSLSSSYVWI